MNTTSIRWSKSVMAVVIAVAGNLASYTVGTSLEASWDVGQSSPVGPVAIVSSTTLALIAGTWGFNFLVSRKPDLARKLSIGGFVFSIVSAPGGYISSSEISTGGALAAMHAITGLAWLWLTASATPSKEK